MVVVVHLRFGKTEIKVPLSNNRRDGSGKYLVCKLYADVMMRKTATLEMSLNYVEMFILG